MRPVEPLVRLWQEQWGDAGLTVRRFGDYRGDATVVALPEPAPALLHDVWVHPDHRRTGVARGMLDAIVRWADRRQRTLMLVAAEETGTIGLDALVAFYESCGFARADKVDPPVGLLPVGFAASLEVDGGDGPRPVMVRYPQARPGTTETTPGRSTVHTTTAADRAADRSESNG